METLKTEELKCPHCSRHIMGNAVCYIRPNDFWDMPAIRTFWSCSCGKTFEIQYYPAKVRKGEGP